MKNKATPEREAEIASEILKAIIARANENSKNAGKCSRPYDIDACLLHTREQEDRALYTIVTCLLKKYGIDAS